MIEWYLLIWRIIITIIIIIIHEFGHYVAFKRFGFTPNFTFSYLQINIGTNVYLKTTVRQYLEIGIMGVLFGLPLAFVDKYILIFYLIIGCSTDFIIINKLIFLMFKGEGNKTIKQINKEGKGVNFE